MGLAHGSKTVGVAVSDPTGTVAHGFETIWRDRPGKIRHTLVRLEEIIKEYQVERIVVGLPCNMNSSLGERAEKALEFCDTLRRRFGMEVVTFDERLTSIMAEKVLMESGVRREDRKAVKDKIAAQLILQGYLDMLSATGSDGREETGTI